MKKILLLIGIGMYCFAHKAIAQTLNANPTTITSDGSVVITGNGEGQVAYYSTLFLSAIRTASGSGSVTGVISNFKAFNKATFAPTSFSLKLTSSSSSPVTVFVELTTTVNNDINQTNNQRTENVAQTITINPASVVQPPPANTTYYNQTTIADFTKNNCGTGYTGSVVRYTVLYNRYSSTISQADANSKATADVNANGQNYANTNGTCTVTPVCYTYTCSANQGFSTTYHFTNCGGTAVQYYVEKGSSITICAQDGTVNGGPYTKGAACH